MKKTLLLSLLGIFLSLTAAAQLPSVGKYYRIVNQNPEKSITTDGNVYGYAITEDVISHGLSAEAQGNNKKFNQLWKWTGTKLQNAHTQRYFNELNVSQKGYTSTTGANVTISNKGSYCLITCKNMAHADGGNSIVGWNDENNKSNWWKFEEVTVNADELAAAQELYKRQQEQKAEMEAIVAREAKIADVVESYFVDKACTEMKGEYRSITDQKLTDHMMAHNLPEDVQSMVLNIKNGWKNEFNPALSARFRVQEYQIYSRCGEKAGDLATPKDTLVATQLSDMNNPTGIWTDALQLLYVFVENEIPEGATLKIAQAAGSEITLLWNKNATTELHQGMNIIYCGLDRSTQWIMYTCAADYQKPLSEYPKMKIHIEGGKVLGYADVAGKDEDAANAEYETIFKNAKNLLASAGVSQRDINFTVKGKYGLMEFPVECYDQIWSDRPWNNRPTAYGYKIYKSMKFYDDVLMWEWSAMGFMDRVEKGEAADGREQLAKGSGDAIYPTYVNNLAPTMMLFEGKNPYSGNSYTCMPSIGAVESSYNAERADFDTWCVGHESGHNNQHTINLPSSMESSNNYFSNIITNLNGYRMSRGWNFDSNYNYVDQKIIFSHRDISITLRMYYNLWLYYHQVGRNKGFTQKLHKLLRADRMVFGGEGWHNGSFGGANKGTAANSWLKFYEKACEAAGEDLTEYFRLWGFFIPTSEAGGSIEKIGNKYYAYCGDYSSYYIRCEEADIKAAIARVKAKKYPENLQIMFVEDRQQLRLRHDAWADGSQYKPDNGGTLRDEAYLKAEYGDLGDINTFIDGSAANSSYTYIQSGRKIKMTGEGGVGFIVYDKDGNIAYMSNRLEFNIPANVAKDGFTIKAINDRGTSSEVADAALTADDNTKLQILQEALNLTGTYTALEDATETKMGYYKSSSLTQLKSLIASAQAAIEASETAQYIDLANRINTEVLRIDLEEGVQKVKSTSLYTITSKRNTGRFMSAAKGILNTASSKSTSTQWAFIPVEGKEDVYYVQNANTKQFIGVTLNKKDKVESYLMEDGTSEGAWKCYLKNIGNGVFCMKPANENTNINMDPNSFKIVNWYAEDEGSQWLVELAQDFEPVEETEVEALISTAKTLVNQVSEYVITKEQFALQCDSKTSNFYLSTNNPNDNATYALSNLIDGNERTYFRTNDNADREDSEYHSLKVDLRSANKTNGILFRLVGVNRNNYATAVKVSGSAAGSVWTEVATIKNMKRDFTSDVIKSSSAYRYWKFEVLDTYKAATDAGEYPWFTASEFELYKASATYKSKPGYEALDIKLASACDTERKNSEADLDMSLLTPWVLYSAWVDLNNAYEALRVKVEELIESGIDGIDGDEEATKAAGIYDLSGRRVKEAGKGVYVVNGKVVVR